MLKLLTKVLRLLGAGILVVAPHWASAQSAASYPNKPVRIIVPFSPGGAPSVLMGILNERFSKDLGQNFIVDNRIGSEGVIGTTAAARAVPDGYTLLGTTAPIVINHWMYPDRSYDTLKDFAMIATLARQDFVLAIHPSVPAKTLKEFIAYAKANPGLLNAGSISTSSILNYQRVMNATDTKLTVINYKDNGPLFIDLLKGTTHIYMSGIGGLQSHITSGKLRGLGTTGEKRSSGIPDVPTFAEAGLANFNAFNWVALLAPAKAPRDIIEKMNAQARRTLESPEVISALRARDFEPYFSTSAQADNFLRTEIERFGELIKAAGLKPGGG